MSAERVMTKDILEMVRLYREGVGYRAVARMVGLSPNSERKYREILREAGLLEGSADALPSAAELRAVVEAAQPPVAGPAVESSALPWKSEIEMLWKKGWAPTAIHSELTERKEGFAASLSSVKRMCLRFKRERGVLPEEVVIRVETEAGDVAQVDFGYVGLLLDDDTHVLRKAWVFVMVLGYSRHMFAEVVFDQSTVTWLRLHMAAFAYLGGVPRTLVPDNLKAAIIQSAFGADRESLVVNHSYRELARHYRFHIDPTPPRAPQKKGKVESGVKYVKHNFFDRHERESVQLVRSKLRVWLLETAGQRIHGTTGLRPLDVFETLERPVLRPLPATPYQIAVWRNARVHPDSHIHVSGALYSVPFVHIGKTVEVRVCEHRIQVFVDDVTVAEHQPIARGYSTKDSHLPEGRSELRHRHRSYWEQKAADMHPDVASYITEVFDSDDVLSQLRVVQAIVSHLATFPVERAAGACRRASQHGSFTYKSIKTILRKGLDLMEATDAEPVHGRLSTPPRYARKPADFRH